MPSTYSFTPVANGSTPSRCERIVSAARCAASPAARNSADPDERHEQLGARLAAELVGARLDDLDHALFAAEVLDAPRAGGERLSEDLGIGHQAPVGAD